MIIYIVAVQNYRFYITEWIRRVLEPNHVWDHNDRKIALRLLPVLDQEYSGKFWEMIG